MGAYAAIALAEGAITAVIARALLRVRPDLVQAARRPARPSGRANPATAASR